MELPGQLSVRKTPKMALRYFEVWHGLRQQLALLNRCQVLNLLAEILDFRLLGSHDKKALRQYKTIESSKNITFEDTSRDLKHHQHCWDSVWGFRKGPCRQGPQCTEDYIGNAGVPMKDHIDVFLRTVICQPSTYAQP